MLKQKWFRALCRWRFYIIVLLLVQLAFMVYAVISGSMASQVINVILHAVSIAASIYVISRREGGIYKLIWVFLILLFPLFGGLFYLLFSFQSSTWRFRKRVARAEKKSREGLRLLETSYEEALTAAPKHAQQIRYLQDFAGFPIYHNSRVEYLSPGEKMLEALLPALEKAEHYIFLEYFIVREGKMWDSILSVLKEKAEAGVKVRLLYDDFGCFVSLPKDYPKRLKEYGIECAIFNPFRPFLTAKQNNRDHRKIVAIDGKIAFTGGINLADEYINAIDRHGHWKDAAVMVEGKAAWSFTLMFLQMWEVATGTDEAYEQYYPWSDVPCTVASLGFALPYADSPMDKENVGAHVYKQILYNAQNYVYICTPYLIVDDSMAAALSLAAKSGVDVRIITPHKGDRRLVHMTTRSYYRELIHAGVKIYEYTNGFIHAKTFVSDETIATVGTTNLDFRSLYMHFECGLWMYGSEAVSKVKEDFLETLKICHPITAKDCKGSLFTRTVQDFLRLFAPLM